MTKLAEMVKLICLVSENTISTFIGDWKSIMNFLHKKKEIKSMALTISQDRL